MVLLADHMVPSQNGCCCSCHCYQIAVIDKAVVVASYLGQRYARWEWGFPLRSARPCHERFIALAVAQKVLVVPKRRHKLVIAAQFAQELLILGNRERGGEEEREEER